MNAVVQKYGEIYRLMLRNSLIREMNFKMNFILWMLVEFLWFALQIAFIEVLFQYTDQIGDWTKWQVVLLVGTHQLTAQLFQAFFYTNLAELPELVRTGRLDFMLLLPVDSQFAVSTRRFGFDSLVNAGVGVGFVVFALTKLAYVPTITQTAVYLLCVALGIAIHYCILFALATGTFWIVRAQGLIYGYYNLFNIARYPREIFRGAFRFVFTWIIPVMLVANVPAGVLAGRFESPTTSVLQLAAATLLILLGTRLWWKFALRRYSSASS